MSSDYWNDGGYILVLDRHLQLLDGEVENRKMGKSEARVRIHDCEDSDAGFKPS